MTRRRTGGILRRNDKDASETLAGINSLIAGRYVHIITSNFNAFLMRID